MTDLTLDQARLLTRMMAGNGRLSPPPGGSGTIWRLAFLRGGLPPDIIEGAVVLPLIEAGLVDGVMGALTPAGEDALAQAETLLASALAKKPRSKKPKAGEAPPPAPPEEEVSPASGGGGGALFSSAKTYVPPEESPVETDPETGLPLDCPVVPLGAMDDQYHYLDARRQFRSLTDEKHVRGKLLGLFTPRHDWLYARFPRYNEKGEMTGWRPEAVQEKLMAACSRRGLWSPRDRLRSAGSWTDIDRRLVMHLGDSVLLSGADGVQSVPPGVVAEMVYPAAEALPGPAPFVHAPEGMGAGQELLRLLQQWNWRRKALDPWLMLGWVVAAFLGGALDFRPVVWVTGDKATGKSTLQDKVLTHVMGRWLLRAADATAASLYQTKGNSSQPIAVDELEPEPEHEAKAAAVIKLARIAASGGKLRRGGQNGQASEYTIMCCFFFSSILIPPLTSADRSRLAELNLDELPPGIDLVVDPPRLREVGQGLLQQSVDGWQRLPLVLDAYRKALKVQGHTNRTADVFGTLLACAWLVLREGVPKQDDPLLLRQARGLNAHELAVLSGDRPDHEQCVYRLLATMADQYRSGTRRTIGQYAHDAAYCTDYETRETGAAALAGYGIKVKWDRGSPDETSQPWLAVANSNPVLAGVFSDTHWKQGGTGQPGGWVQALRRVPGAVVPPNGISIGGQLQRCTLLPMRVVLPEQKQAEEEALLDLEACGLAPAGEE